MQKETNTTEQQIEDKTRCSQFLLDMIEKYGASILEEEIKTQRDVNQTL